MPRQMLSGSLVTLRSNMEVITLVVGAFTGITSIIAAYVAFMWWIRRNDNYWKDRGVSYRPRQGIIDVFREMSAKPLHEIFQENYRTYGRVHGGFEFRTPTLTVCEPELLRYILIKDFNIFNHRRDMVTGEPVTDKMVTNLKGEEWKRIRTRITPAFTSKRMRHMSHIMHECSNFTVKALETYADKKEPVDFKSIFGAFAMDVTASAAFATTINSRNDPQNVFVQKVKRAFIQPPVWRLVAFFFLPTWFIVKFRLGLYFQTEFFKTVILSVIKHRKQTPGNYNDILQLLLDAQEDNQENHSRSDLSNGAHEDESDQYGSVLNNEINTKLKYNKLSEEELVSQCVLFFIVGYETSASTLGFLAYSLALNQECQEILIKEIDEIFEKNEELDYDVVRGMRYLDMCVSETLRMYPSLTRVERTTCEDYQLGDTGITIEKGTIIGYNIHAMHNDEEFFPNPETFDPERFRPGNIHHPKHAYLPFGAGPRNCLGMRFALMEIKICMCNLLRHYRLKPSDITKVPLEYKKAHGLLIVETLPLLVEKRAERV